MPAPKISTAKPPVKTPVTKRPVTVAGKPAKTVSATRVKKNFNIVDWDRAGCKVLLYAKSGMGKTTLAMLLNDPVFIGTDDGGGIMRHPVTGEQLKVVDQIEDYQDVRDAINSDVFANNQDIVVDTITDVQRWMVPYMLENITIQGGGKAKNLEDYGYHKGYRHWLETMELLLSDLNQWVRKGKNIILLAQETAIKMSNEGGEDYKIAGPDLYHDDKCSILNLVKSWCDHVFRINHTNLAVDKKKAKGATERAVYLHPRAEFIAKSRTISEKDFPCVEFKNQEDDSVWRLLFNEN